MKNNCNKIAPLLSQSINLCGEDAVLQEVKTLLKKALALTQGVGNKRNKRVETEDYRIKMEKEAKEKYKKWMESIKTGLGKTIIPEEEKGPGAARPVEQDFEWPHGDPLM